MRSPRPMAGGSSSPPFRAPRANAFANRWVRTVRREYMDWTRVRVGVHACTYSAGYVAHYKASRPHRGLSFGAPDPRRILPLRSPTSDACDGVTSLVASLTSTNSSGAARGRSPHPIPGPAAATLPARRIPNATTISVMPLKIAMKPTQNRIRYVRWARA
jgi:hypothetical protein